VNVKRYVTLRYVVFT